MPRCEDKAFCRGHSIVFTRHLDPAAFGKLHRNQDPCAERRTDHDVFDGCARGGILTLHIQSIILQLLVRVCELILHDKSEFEMLNGPEQAEPPALDSTSTDDTVHNSFSELLLLLAPFQVRHDIASTRPRTYTSAILTNLKDHVWALREDPLYLADTIKEHEYHKRTLPGARENEYRIHIIRFLVEQAYGMLAGWHQLDAYLASFTSVLDEGSDLAQHSHAIDRFLCNTMSALESEIPIMCSAFIQSQPMRGVRNFHDVKLRSWKARVGRFGNMTLVQHEVYQALDKVLEVSSEISKIREKGDLTGVVMQLVYALETVNSVLRQSSKARGLVSRRVACMLWEVSVLSECLCQAFIWRELPHIRSATCGENCPHTTSNDFDDFYEHYIHDWNDFPAPIDQVYPYQERLRYAAHKRQTQNNAIAMRDAEANLDTFWGIIDASFLKLTGVGPPRIGQECLREGGILRRTAPWEEDVNPAVSTSLATL